MFCGNRFAEPCEDQSAGEIPSMVKGTKEIIRGCLQSLLRKVDDSLLEFQVSRRQSSDH